MSSGICELDVHGLNLKQAEIYITSQLRRAGRDVYRLRIIHGYHGGTGLRDMIRSRYAAHPKVIRIEFGLNQGETDLILRELYKSLPSFWKGFRSCLTLQFL